MRLARRPGQDRAPLGHVRIDWCRAPTRQRRFIEEANGLLEVRMPRHNRQVPHRRCGRSRGLAALGGPARDRVGLLLRVSAPVANDPTVSCAAAASGCRHRSIAALGRLCGPPRGACLDGSLWIRHGETSQASAPLRIARSCCGPRTPAKKRGQVGLSVHRTSRAHSGYRPPATGRSSLATLSTVAPRAKYAADGFTGRLTDGFHLAVDSANGACRAAAARRI